MAIDEMTPINVFMKKAMNHQIYLLNEIKVLLEDQQPESVIFPREVPGSKAETPKKRGWPKGKPRGVRHAKS